LDTAVTAVDARPTAPVSVIIPCYRCRATIERAVSSVARQSVLPAELIVVDDGSGDGSLEHLHGLASRHVPGWMRVLSLPENRGAADARNVGWDSAAQPYLAFLDADDAWHRRKIEIQLGYLTAHPGVTLIAHGREILYAPDVPDREIGPVSALAVSRRSILMSNNFFAPTVMMLRRDLPHRFLKGRRHVDDHLLWMQIVCSGGHFVRLSPALAFTYKKPYGESGLSGQLWRMEKAELQNYWLLRRDGYIGAGGAVALTAWSLAKFARRLLVTILRRLSRSG
jgi:glycosyltransferase involved in cell wall biosynthesis